MRFREIGRGSDRLTVSAIGLGEMPLSLRGRPDQARAIATIHAALDAGVTLIDTAASYRADSRDTGHGDRLVAAALATCAGDADAVLVATKGVHPRAADGGWAVNGRPEYLTSAVEESFKALGVEAIGLHQHHRPDPKVPYAESVGAMKELLDESKPRFAGVSNANIGQIKSTDEILGGTLAGVQNQFAPDFRSSESELVFTRESAFLPWSPLGCIGQAAAAAAELLVDEVAALDAA